MHFMTANKEFSMRHDALSTNHGNLKQGTDVYGSDDAKVGSIAALYPNYLVVEKGFWFPTDYYIPVSAINRIDDDRVYLSVTKDAALNQGWDAVPANYDTAAPVGDYDNAVPPATYDTAGHGTDYGTAAHRTDTGERTTISVHEEELTASRQPKDVGRVRIEKDVVSEERTIDVPVTEERVRVERHAVDRPVNAADGTAFKDEVIDVPVYGEEVTAEKRVRVAEEIDVTKEQAQRTERVTGTVRREDVRVVDDATGTEGGVIGGDR
jgi:uncharacterized protein (TIGR02271 family)